MSNVTTMEGMFYDAISFNQPLNEWNVSNVTTMDGMFYDASDFNQPLNTWNVSNVTHMGKKFFQLLGSMTTMEFFQSTSQHLECVQRDNYGVYVLWRRRVQSTSQHLECVKRDSYG